MEFVTGSVTMLASFLLLSAVGRLSAARPFTRLLSGDYGAPLVAVFFTVVMTFALSMMIVGGEVLAGSIGLELALILPLVVVGAALATWLAGKPRA